LLLDETHELGVQLLGLEEEHVVVDDGSTRVNKRCRIEIGEGWRCQRNSSSWAWWLSAAAVLSSPLGGAAGGDVGGLPASLVDARYLFLSLVFQ